MNYSINIIYGLLLSMFILTSCGTDRQAKEDADQSMNIQEVRLSAKQFADLKLIVDTLPKRNIADAVNVAGRLEVSPQNQAVVTAIVGANITSIQVHAGDQVRKGQVLAYLSHPNIIQMQNDYLEAYNRLQFLEQEFQRQKTLFEEDFGSGKAFQETQRDYRSAQGTVQSFESQLRQLGINASKIRSESFYEQIPLVSPINGSIVAVHVKIGQYVAPEKELFEIVNTDQVHADFIVFAKDVAKVKEGQQVRFFVETLPSDELIAEIYSVGKTVEQEPKAMQVHAAIKNKSGRLIPGMYIKGEILTDPAKSYALPEKAIVQDGDKHYAFIAKTDDSNTWIFNPIEILKGKENKGWVEIKVLQALESKAHFAMNKAYYLMAEMKKDEIGDEH